MENIPCCGVPYKLTICCIACTNVPCESWYRSFVVNSGRKWAAELTWLMYSSLVVSSLKKELNAAVLRFFSTFFVSMSLVFSFRFKVKEFTVVEVTPYPIRLSWEGNAGADGAESMATGGENIRCLPASACALWCVLCSVAVVVFVFK